MSGKVAKYVRAALVLALLIGLPSLASAQDRRPNLEIPTVLLINAGALDLWTTADCLSVGCHETNPAIKWLQPKGIAPMLIAGAGMEIAGYWAVRTFVAPKHPRLAQVGIYAAAVAHAYFAGRNMQQAKLQRFCNANPRGPRC